MSHVAGSLEHGAWSLELGAWSVEPGAWSVERIRLKTEHRSTEEPGLTVEEGNQRARVESHTSLIPQGGFHQPCARQNRRSCSIGRSTTREPS
jgi:hypothetical protein